MRLKCGATAWTAWPRRVASRAVYSTRFAALAIRGPHILRTTRLMVSQPMSLLVSHNLVLSGRVKNVYRHLLHFLTLMLSNEVETDQYIFHLLFQRHICADYLCHFCIDMLVVRLAPCHWLNQCWHTQTWTNFSGVHIKILTSFRIHEKRLKISCAKRRPFCHSIRLLDYENHRCYVSIQFL